jgi:ParB-like chromosome segregation protein Spo0J
MQANPVTEPELLSLSPVDPRIVKNGWNTNVVTPENEAKLEASIKRNGMFKPIIVREQDDKLEVIGGEHRWEIAQKLGLQTIPVVNLGKIDDKRAKEISVIDNARYGIDDTLSFADLLKELGDAATLQDFLPYTETDFAEIFSSADISLDDLDVAENDTEDAAKEDDPAPARPAKTHTIMRFKIGLRDAERVTALIASTQKTHGLTASDELTNAGDALVELLFGGAGEGSEPPEDQTIELEDLELDE